MRRLALVLCLAACGASPDAERSVLGVDDDAIVGGEITSTQPAVGALWDDIVGPFCTATLIGSRTVLTAAHCLDDLAKQTWFVGGVSAWRPDFKVEMASFAQHPSYDPFEKEYDIAVITLVETAPVQPLPLVRELRPSLVGTKLRFVGYGVSNPRKPNVVGTKMMVDLPVGALNETTYEYEGDGSTCFGDSGGPGLLRTRGGFVVAGVVREGEEYCTGLAIDTRVDIYRDFISEHLAPGDTL